ncbi:MAG: glycosyltransferase [Actinobacteria bacterium]|nr:glycosyltransferase [Actinomycetota bacterium]
MRVAHVIGNLATGGAETQLATYLAASSIRNQCVMTLSGESSDSVKLPEDTEVRMLFEKQASDIRTSLRLSAQTKGFDVVCAWAFRAYVLSAGAVRPRRPPALVANVRSMDYFYRTHHRVAEHVAFLRANAIVANTRESADRIGRARVLRPKLHVLPNGVRLYSEAEMAFLRAQARKQAPSPPDGLRVLCVGREDPVKGHRQLLEAFALHRRTGGTADRLTLVGRGVPILEQDVQRLGLSGCCELLEDCPDTRSLVVGSDIFVLPSLSEGMPNALLEAMALGVPCIATAVGGAVDLACRERCLELVPPSDVVELARAMGRLIRSVDERTELGAAGRVVVSREHSIGAMAQGYDELFGELSRR